MKAVFNTEDLNSYGFWVKTSGISLKRFKKNPVLTFNHNTYGMAVGKITELKNEDGKLVGEVEFDTEDDAGKNLARKYEKGYMSGFSIGIRVLELSDKELKPNQSRSTVTKSELIEIAAATIPANASAVKLYNEAGGVVELSATGFENYVPLINKKMSEEKTTQNVEQTQNKQALNDNSELKQMFVELGKTKGVINQENKKYYEKLFDLDRELARKFVELSEKQNAEKQQINEQKDTTQRIKTGNESISKFFMDAMLNADKIGEKQKTWSDYSEAELENLRDKDTESYKKLFFEHYGFEPEL